MSDHDGVEQVITMVWRAHDLLCDVKYEFNSDNRRLYAQSMVLMQGALSS
jgi:hypothetical protein